jgi:hypothetical protein
VTSCGLWLARRRLVAVLVGDGGEARRTIRAALTGDARFGLIEYLAQAGCEIVATEALARADLLPAQAARRGTAVWTADDGVVAAWVGAGIRDPARCGSPIPLARDLASARLAPPPRSDRGGGAAARAPVTTAVPTPACTRLVQARAVAITPSRTPRAATRQATMRLSASPAGCRT